MTRNDKRPQGTTIKGKKKLSQGTKTQRGTKECQGTLRNAKGHQDTPRDASGYQRMTKDDKERKGRQEFCAPYCSLAFLGNNNKQHNKIPV